MDRPTNGANFPLVRNLFARIRGIDPRHADYLLAGLLMLAEGIECFVWGDGPGEIALGFIPVAGMAPLAVRRTRPLIAGIAQPTTMVIGNLVSHEIAVSSTTTFLALLVTLYSLGRYAAPRPGIRVASYATAVVGVTTLIQHDFDYSLQVLWILMLGAGPYLIGRAVRNRTRLRDELLDRTRELERDRELHAARAVDDERVRIAEELQVVVANGVSAMVLQAEAVPRVIASGDGAKAEHALAVIEETGRDALAEMRRLLGVLRRDGESPSLAPLPTLSEAARLAAQRTAEGLAVDLDYEGEEVKLAPGADLAAYRVLQEALEASASGGASSASVQIAYSSDELRIDVTDDREDPRVDQPALLAMRERLGLYGGRVLAGTGEAGRGVHVTARLPLNGGAG